MIKLESHLGDAVFVTSIETENLKISNKWADTTHFHVDSELHILLSGNAVIEIDGDDVEVGAGDVCVLAPGSSHYPKCYSNTLEKTNFYIILTRDYNDPRGGKHFSEYAYYSRILRSFNKYFIINDSELVSIVKKILAEELNSQNEHVVSAYLSIFYITLASRMKEQLLLDIDEPVRQSAEGENLFRQRRIVEEFFQKRYNEEVGIEDLARELCLSASHTHRIVKRVFNEGFKQTLMKQRIEHACMLIKQKELTLTEIAYSCGYTSYNGFLSAFKSHVGKSPKEFEKSVR